MSKRTVLITGGNTGIGLESAAQIGETGAHIVITSRSAERGESARKLLQSKYGVSADVVALDLASFDSIRACANHVLANYEQLDVLVNNAGLVLSERMETEQGFEYTIGVNHIGPALLTKLLLPRILESDDARVVNLASAAHRSAITGLPWGDMQHLKGYTPLAYAQSKLCNILYTRSLAEKFGDAGLYTCAVHPGIVASDFARDGDTKGLFSLFYAAGPLWMKTPEKAARTTVWASTEPQARRTQGAYLKNCRVAGTSRFARNAANAQRLWDMTEHWIKQEHP